MLIIGIDPGSKGALCALNPSTTAVMFFPTPNIETSPLEVFEWILHMESTDKAGVRIIGIEDVHSVQGTSAKSNFSFGRNVGVVNAIASCTRISTDHVTPKVWQKNVGIPQKRPLLQGTALKKAIGAHAKKLYPKAELQGPQGGLLDGRADALMIAHYFALKYGIN